MTAIASATGLLLLLSGAQPKPGETPLAERYRVLVEEYRDGRIDHSVEGMLALDQNAVWRVVQDLREHGGTGHGMSLDDDFFKAASIMHVDAAVRLWVAGSESGRAQLHLGGWMLDASALPDPEADDFRRRWYAATALLVARHESPERAQEYFASAVEQLPDDVPLLTAAGWFSERLSEGAAAPGASLRNSQTLRRRHQRSAERYLSRAIDADPRAEEAALRLAHVESLMGRDARAAGRLSALLARDDLMPFTAYLARLFLADIRAREGEADAARQLLRDALAIDPVAQSARVALAELLYASGDSGAAAEVIEPLATPASGRQRNDPFSDYQLAYPAVGSLLLDDLRDEVQR